MIPVNEGNEECRNGKCKHFDGCYGCIPTYNNNFPPCGRDVILTQKHFKELLKAKKKEKRHIFRSLRRIFK